MKKTAKLFSVIKIKNFLMQAIIVLGTFFLASIVTYQGHTSFFNDGVVIKVPDNTIFQLNPGQYITKTHDQITFKLNNIQYHSSCPNELYQERICNKRYKDRYYLSKNILFSPWYKTNNHIFGVIRSGYLYDKNSQYEKYLLVDNQYIKSTGKINIFVVKVGTYIPYICLFIILVCIFLLSLLKNKRK